MELSLPADHRFRILRCLGAGGMGVVYEVEDRQLGRRSALKTLRAEDGQALYRLKTEFRQLQGIRHPNLVRLEEFLQEPGMWLLLMELVEGVGFLEAARFRNDEDEDEELVDDSPGELPPCPSDPDRLRSLLLQLAEAVASLHAAGKVHCDLKPSNVLVTDHGRVVVLDFGLIMAQETGRTVEGSILGTPLYMSPEQCRGARLTAASDWYSVGAILYEALTGRPPHQGTLMQVLAAKQHRNPEPPECVARGVPPDLASLCMEMLRCVPAQRPSDDEILQALSTRRYRPVLSLAPEAGRGRFVGRDDELGILRRAFEQSLRGKPVAVHVRGASGLGKTTLVEQLLGEVDATVLRGRCYERETVPYKAWDALIDDLSRHLRRLSVEAATALLPQDIGALARLFPVLNRLDAVRRSQRGPVPDRDPDALRRRAIVALSELFGRMAARRPLVLFLDDLQWGDRDSVRLLLELFGLPDPPPVLLVLAYRCEDIDRSACLRELLDLRHREVRALSTSTLEVRPLDPAASLDLARSLVGEGRPDAPTIAQQIAHESLGSPLFAGELFRALETLDVSSDEVGRLSLDALIFRRLCALDEPARWLLKTIAVAGAPIPQAAVSLAAGLAADGSAVLDQLRSERLVRSSGRAPNDVVETFHDRIRETIVDSLAPAARRERHEAIARALLELPDSDPELVARQWLLAGKAAEASVQLLRAAEAAERALAFDHAADLYEAVLEANVFPQEAERSVMNRRADALAHAGRAAASARAYLSCAERTEGIASLDLRRRATEQLFRAGLFEEGRKARLRLFADVGIDAPRSDAASLASIAWYSTRSLARRFSLSKAPVQPDEHVRLQLDVLATNTAASSLPPLEWMALTAQWQSRALAAGDLERSALALATYHGGIVAYPGGKVFSRRAAEAVAAMLPSVADPVVHYQHEFSLGLRELFAQRFDAALAHLERAVSIAREAGPRARLEAAVSEATLGWARVALGRLRKCFAEARQSHAAILRRGDRSGEMCFAALASLAALAEDDAERASALLEAVAPRPGAREGYYEFDGRLTASRIDRYLRDESAFRRMETSFRELRQNQVFSVALPAALARKERAHCALSALDLGVDVAAARRVAEEELGELSAQPGTVSRYDAALIGAGLAHHQGRRDQAVERLLEAEKVAVGEKLLARVHYARYRRGSLIGGADGARLVDAAEAYLSSEGIANPSAWMAMNAPGFGR